LQSKQTKLAVVGLGYVGLPLALEFGKIIPAIGFDVNPGRVKELQTGVDSNKESAPEDIKAASLLEYTSEPEKLKEASFIVVAVPTPITKNKQPDLSCLIKASQLVGENMQKGSVVVFESTVYPGVTEEVCVPVLEEKSGFKYKKDFKVAYSPERINPGDKEHTLANIIKVVSGCDKETLDEVAAVYELVVRAGVHKAPSIKCAEAAKVIENTQRDLNIALMNELAIIFQRLGVDTLSILEAAATKWNFIKMKPGLVGGHCIGVDPYYLTYKSEEVGYHPQVILAGRRINDGMGKYIAEAAVKCLIEADKPVKGAKVLLFGITFKENVSDIRNSRVIDIVRELKEFGVEVLLCDPLADKDEVKKEYGIDLIDYHSSLRTDGVIIAVKHDIFKELLTPDTVHNHFRPGASSLEPRASRGVVVDVKGMFSKADFENADIVYWRL